MMERHKEVFSLPSCEGLDLLTRSTVKTNLSSIKSAIAFTVKTPFNMKLTSIVALLFAGTALAAPSKLAARRNERLRKRMESRKSNLPLAVNYTSMGDSIKSDNPGFVTYSSNWAGAVIVTTDVTEVTGTFTVPTAEIPSGGSDSTEYGAAAWVGIDGDTCETGKSSFRSSE